MALTDVTARQLLAQLDEGQVSARELVQAYLRQIAAHDEQVGAFLEVDGDAALARAEEIDQRRQAGARLGRLAGLPVAVKDILCTRGRVTSCGSKMLADFRPPYDATVVQRLADEDAVLLGKTNLDEFAMGGSTENSALRTTRNPWNLACVPGGSSGGAAACVAAGMVPLSIGTDTGGSIRQPAAYCGVTGLKPTYGRVSRYGLVAFASSLDQAGPLARTAEDAALLLQTIAGHDPRDATSADTPVPDYLAMLARPWEGLRIGLPREHFADGLSSATEQSVREAVRVFESLGASVREITLPHAPYAIATYYIVAPCEASSNLARYEGVHYGYRTDESALRQAWQQQRRELQESDPQAAEQQDSLLVAMYRRTRSEGFGPEVKRRIMLGTYALSAGYKEAYYLKALKVRRLIRQDYLDAFADVDLILGPVTPGPAFRLGEKRDDPLAMYLTDLFTVAANLAGIASLSIPCGFSPDGLPIGLQLQAPSFGEGALLHAAHAFQQETDWHTRRPPLA